MISVKTIIERMLAKPEHGLKAEDAEWMSVKQVELGSAVIDMDKRLVMGMVSTTSVDMDDEVVVPSGLDTSYFPERVRAVYLDHDYKQLPSGTCVNLGKRRNGLWAVTCITNRPIGQDLLTAIDEGALRHFSVGIRATSRSAPTPDEVKMYGPCRSVIRAGKLIEYSLTAMPANADCLMELVSKGAIRRDSAVAFGLDDTPERKFYATTEPKHKPRVTVLADGSIVW